MRLIDADALLTILDIHRNIYGDENLIDLHRGDEVDCSIAYVKAAKTVDAVEVVRCIDCKHFKDSFCNKHFDGYPRLSSWYCADGERKIKDGDVQQG